MAINPFAIYTCSFYSESFFFLSQSLILYILQYSIFKHSKITIFYLIFSLFPIFIGCCIRSNGFLSIGYPIYYYLMVGKFNSLKKKIKHILKCSIPVIIMIVFAFIPFIIYNLWGFHSVCSVEVEKQNMSELCLNYSYGILF